jgi:Fe-S cluster assembly protein SufD
MSGFNEWLTTVPDDYAPKAMAIGLPSKRLESWKYVPTRSLSRTIWQPACVQTGVGFALTAGQFINIPEQEGLKHTDNVLTDLEEKRISRLSEVNGFALTQAALEQSRLIFEVQATKSLDINLGHLANQANAAGFATLVLRIGAGATVNLIELFKKSEVNKPNLGSIRFVITLERDATLTHIRFQSANRQAHIFSNIDVCCEENAHYRLQSIDFGAKLARNDIHIALSGIRASASVNGLAVTSGSQYHDTHLAIDHVVGNTKSDMTFRNMVDEHGEATFNGRVLIRQDSQKSATEQSVANLLLSDTARVNPKPELEIYADDVTASHGCTVGSLSKDELFYLKSRGLSEADARAFLQYAFAEGIVERIEHEHIRELVETQLLGELTHGDLIAELRESVYV